ncbi:MAG: UDP-N-acetylmuramate dehydrogenase [Bacteroidales bacterium]|nr:UDP-N-acetylmuramate dehydrogenase [Bacteroidales bacterium]
MNIQHHVSLKPYNSFHVDVQVDTFIEIETEDELKVYLSERNPQEKLFVVGDGGNLLFVHDFHGTILKMQNKGIAIVSDGDYKYVRASAGEDWDGFVRYTLENKCYGLENLALIPGKVGSAAVQNIGAYGREACDFINKVYAIDIQTNKSVVFSNEECKFAYRNSIFKQELKGKYVITAVEFRLFSQPKPCIHYADVQQRLEKEKEVNCNTIYRVVSQIRQEKLPDVETIGNAGSFFKNPIVDKHIYDKLQSRYEDLKSFSVSEKQCKLSAAQLIEKCGWKGKTMGKAGVYQKQPLVLINCGGAKGQDILNLAQNIQHDVFEQFGVELEMEVNVI